MKKILNKLTIIILLILGVFLMSGCDEKEQNGNSNEKPPIILPTETKQVSNDETIYVIYDKNNDINTIKSSNHFVDAGVFKYEVEGKFLSNGHLNITNGQAKIEILDGKAYVPSLQKRDNFFYTLNLDPVHYKSKLPYNLVTKYKLNGNEVTLDKLNNATGEVVISYNFTANNDANIYYSTNYAAQVQIPIDISTATITEANDAMAQVLVGTTNTLAYMVMPGQSKEIVVKLTVKNFKYAGLQAVYQPLDQISSISGMFDFNSLGFGQLQTLPTEMGQLIDGIDQIDSNVNELFVGMDQKILDIKNELSNEMLSNYIAALQTMNFDIFKDLGSYNAGFEAKKDELVAVITPVEQTIGLIGLKAYELSLLSSAYESSIENYTEMAQRYEQVYLNFLNSKQKVAAIQGKIAEIATIDFNDIYQIIENKELMITNLNAIETSVEELKVILTNTINAMYFHRNEFEPLVNDIVSMVNKYLELFETFPLLKLAFTNLVNKIEEGFAGNWFSLAAMQNIQTIYGTLTHEDPTMQQPGIIQSLDLILLGAEDLEANMAPIQELHNLYQIDPLLQMRPIDAIYLGFVTFNNGLLVKAEGKPSSFYDGMNQLTSLTDLLSLIPLPLEMDLPSFLSENNLSPISLQFIITQK